VNIKLANHIFSSIDTKNTGKLDQDNLSAYFKEYSDSSVKIILKEMDFNHDGIITRSEWIGYWEYVRLAGYDEKSIKKSVLLCLFSSPKCRKEWCSLILREPVPIKVECQDKL